jgi:HSP20 family protein
MNVLTRWDPLQEMLDFNRAMDLVRQRSGALGDGQQQFDLSMDIYETPDGYEIEAALPGVKPEDVEITLNNNVLTIRGETRMEEEKEDRNYHLRERRVGAFVRSITLPSSINADAIEAHYDNGVLKLRLPKAEEAKPKHIQIKPNGSTSKARKEQSKGTSS